MNRKQGCLAGFGEFFLFGWLFRWLQRTFGTAGETVWAAVVGRSS